MKDPSSTALTRSYLFVPGDKPDLLARADQRGADALIIDLEDAVAQSNKAKARDTTHEWLTAVRLIPSQRWVRINSDQDGREDLEMLKGMSIRGVVLPKIADADDLHGWAKRVDSMSPDCPLIVLIETAGALRDLDRVVAHPRSRQLMMGEMDLAADTGISQDNPVWDALRADVVVASAAAGIAPPIGPVDPDFSSPSTLESDTRRLKALGFGARGLIHPGQIEPVHRAFVPTHDEVAEARQMIALHEASIETGQGVHVGDGGQMVDEALVRNARRVIENLERET